MGGHNAAMGQLAVRDEKKKDEVKTLDEVHQRKASQMIKSADGSAGLLHRIRIAHGMERGGVQLFKEEDARLMARCEEKWKEWATRWQCDENVEKVNDKL